MHVKDKKQEYSAGENCKKDTETAWMEAQAS